MEEIIDFINVIHGIIDDLVKDPSHVEITELPNESKRDKSFQVAASSQDIGRLIGRQGIIADAIRTLVNTYGRDNHYRVHLKFQSIDENSVEEDK